MNALIICCITQFPHVLWLVPSTFPDLPFYCGISILFHTAVPPRVVFYGAIWFTLMFLMIAFPLLPTVTSDSWIYPVVLLTLVISFSFNAAFFTKHSFWFASLPGMFPPLHFQWASLTPLVMILDALLGHIAVKSIIGSASDAHIAMHQFPTCFVSHLPPGTCPLSME